MNNTGEHISKDDVSYLFGWQAGPPAYNRLVQNGFCEADETVGDIASTAVSLAIARSGREDIKKPLALYGLIDAIDAKTLRGDKQL